MEIQYILEKMRNAVMDGVMLAVTVLGDETAFLVIALIMLWCVDKKRGYFLLFVGFLGNIINQFLKLAFRIPRPWVKDPGFSIVEGSASGATGYSFPSGHTQSSVGTFGAIAATEKNRWVRIVCVAIAVLVPFSRMYLGVHTPQDVLVSVGIALLLIFLLRPIVMGESKWGIPILLIAMTACSIAYLLYAKWYPFPVDMDAENLYHGQETAHTLLGCLLGFLIVYPVEKKWIKYPVKAAWWAQILKTVVGLVLVLAVKEGLKSPLNDLFGLMTGRAVRYFLVVQMAGLVWPLTFRFFTKIGHKE